MVPKNIKESLLLLLWTFKIPIILQNQFKCHFIDAPSAHRCFLHFTLHAPLWEHAVPSDTRLIQGSSRTFISQHLVQSLAWSSHLKDFCRGFACTNILISWFLIHLYSISSFYLKIMQTMSIKNFIYTVAHFLNY